MTTPKEDSAMIWAWYWRTNWLACAAIGLDGKVCR